MTHLAGSNSSPDIYSVRRNKTPAELLRTLFNKTRLESGPVDQGVEIAGLSSFIARAGGLGIGEIRILNDYAGRTIETRTRVLEEILSHRDKNDNQPPIVYSNGTGKDEKWTCRLCPDPTQPLPDDGRKPFVKTFQKVATHITSNHWELSIWLCPVESCARPYRLPCSLRRHMNKCLPNATPAQTAQTGTIDAAVEYQPRRFNGLPEYPSVDQRPRDITPQPQILSRSPLPLPHPVLNRSVDNIMLDSYHTGSPNQEWPRHRDIILEAQLGLMFDQTPPPRSPPVLNQLIGNGVPDSYPTGVYGAYGPMDTISPHVTTAAQQFQLARATQRVQTNAIGLPISQYLPHGNMCQGNVTGSWFNDPTSSQPGPSSSSASSNFNRPVIYSAAQNYSRGYSAPENEQWREVTRALPSSGHLEGQDFVGSSGELAPDTFWSSDQGPWWP